MRFAQRLDHAGDVGHAARFTPQAYDAARYIGASM
jgi:hypothetical protein